VPLTISEYRGEFKPSADSGGFNIYLKGDVVLYEGKLFYADEEVRGLSPDQTDTWLPWGGSRLSYRSIKPQDPKIGDMWLNSGTGKLYTYFDDGDTKQFVEF
tara:strand:+ start:479 stop:784 length:306 start_codon:yes stop_codon:yes gene_type:complete